MSDQNASQHFNTNEWNSNYNLVSTSKAATCYRKIMLRQIKFDKLVKDKNKTILDIGCGNGPYLKFFHSQGFRNLFGVEPDKDLVDQIPVEIATAKVGIAEKLEFDDNFFDVVFVNEVMHHLKEKEDYYKAISEIHRVLKPEGIVFIIEPGRKFVWNLMEYTALVLGLVSKLAKAWNEAIREEKNELFLFIENHPVVVDGMRKQQFQVLVDKNFIYSWIYVLQKKGNSSK